MTSWTIGDVEVTRVEDPGFELVLPQDEDTVVTLAQSQWLQPTFVTADGSLRVGSSATVIRTGDTVILVDPFLAFDDPATLGPRLSALRGAGVEAEDVDLVVNTHVDGTGVNLLADGTPTFPRARVLVPLAELEELRAGTHADARGLPLVPLWDDGPVEASTGTETLAPGVRLEDAPGHNPGHHVVWIEDGGQSAVIVGHLFLHPAQIALPDVAQGDRDPVVLAETRRALLARAALQHALLIGPLFAPPGAGRVVAVGDGWELRPEP